MTFRFVSHRVWNSLFLLVLALVTLGGAAEAQTPKAYVAMTAANSVVVIDTAGESVAGTVVAGTGPTRVAVSRDGTRAYVLNRNADSISVIDAATDTNVATIAVGDNPSSLAVTPDGRQIYAVLDAGVVQAIDTSLNIVTAEIAVEGNGGGVAITPDGAYAFVASGGVTLIHTATNTIADFFYLEGGNVHAVALSPDGRRAYFLTNGMDIFGSEAGVIVLDTVTCAVIRKIVLGALPGQMALAPDGSRVYVGIQNVWVNTGYGAAFIPGRSVAVIDAIANAWIGSIDLGAAGAAWTLQNTAAGIAVAADRSDVYVSVPRLGAVAVINTSTNVVRQLLTVGSGSGPNGLAVVPDAAAVLIPYVIDAVDDNAPLSMSSTGGVAVESVLANDRIGGAPVTLAHVTLSKQSSTDPHIGLDATSGPVKVAAGAPLGSHVLEYQICEIASPLNCDRASVRLTVRNPYVIDAVNDTTTSLAGRNVLVSVLANDTLGGGVPTLATVKVAFVSSTHSGITLDTANGSVFAAPGTAVGSHVLVYRICETAAPANCDTASVAVTIVPLAIDAVNDIGVSTRAGGVAQGNVLANDKFAGAVATLAKVKLTFVSSTSAGVTLNAGAAAVLVAAGTAAGTYALVYRICEIASPSNCDQATVTVTVNPYVINAVNDSARASSKVAGTALASVLTNDFLGNVRATIATVRLSLVSLTPNSSLIRLDSSDGSVDVLGKVNSGRYQLVYRICEIASPSNCDTATVTLDLSGSGN